MSASSLPASRSPDISRIATGAAPALAIGLILLGLIFRTEAMAAYQVWNESTAYSHCFFVLPIALYLAWDRRQNLLGCRWRRCRGWGCWRSPEWWRGWRRSGWGSWRVASSLR